MREVDGRRMKTIDEMCEVMQAYKNGKKIECCNSHDPEHEWGYVDEPMWNWYECDYRVKSEPHYVPYDSVMEVDKDKWIVRKPDTSFIYRISAADREANKVFVAGAWWTMELLLERFEYEDGTPCGKKAEIKIYNEF